MKVARNSPCPCGSQLKAKRCCSAPPERQVDTPRARLARLQTTVAADIDRSELRALYDEMIYLPELDLSLHMRLPCIRTPEIAWVADALSSGDGERFDAALAAARPSLDSIEGRLELAQALLKLRDDGRISAALAAIGIIDLNQPGSALVTSALAQAIAVTAGDERTPSGLLVAAR